MVSQVQPPSRERFKSAIESLKDDITIPELAYLLVQAVEEVIEEGKDPITDPAVALISGRIGFASPADTANKAMWDRMIDVCEKELDAKLEFRGLKQ
jgi:hypothetical protein